LSFSLRVSIIFPSLFPSMPQARLPPPRLNPFPPPPPPPPSFPGW
jgi:hypothetical protein